MRSWHTTISAIITFLIVILGAVKLEMDLDPGTRPDYNEVMEAIRTLMLTLSGMGMSIGYGLFRARDNHKSDAQAGAGGKLFGWLLAGALLFPSVAQADPYDDLITISQQCKIEYVQTEQARAAETAAEAKLVDTQRARDVVLAGYDQQAIDAEMLRLSAELQMAVSTQNWPAFARLMAELAEANAAREQAKGKFDTAQAAVEAASAALTVAERNYVRENEERLAALESLRKAIDVITRPG